MAASFRKDAPKRNCVVQIRLYSHCDNERAIGSTTKTELQSDPASTISLDRYIYTFTHDSDCDKIFKDAIEKGNPLHEVKLEAVFSIQGQTPAKVSFLLSVFFQGKSTNINDIKHKRVKD